MTLLNCNLISFTTLHQHKLVNAEERVLRMGSKLIKTYLSFDLKFIIFIFK